MKFVFLSISMMIMFAFASNHTDDSGNETDSHDERLIIFNTYEKTQTSLCSPGYYDPEPGAS
ncbi:MAG: hypothetical protein VXX59_01675, partial [Candidatus Thermoplasmatota archaeon]|nr:hypothetical protein [Candidatus Thermoplasmatota archaeon]